ncbi:methyltransferase [Pseudoalteromonas galatheae]|uniref:methyltransferase n=2 Tax=Pseudoalteromonas galatheae TaxID=579562 RepID=UPI0030D02D31
MSRISTAKYNKHEQALSLLRKEFITYEEKEFIFANFHEGASNNNGKAGAFFTPLELAKQLPIFAPFPNLTKRPIKILDLCAGIGSLAFATYHAYQYTRSACEIVCLEQNPEYVKAGKKLLPEANWIEGDVTNLSLILSLGEFDCVISNPPFGSVATFRGATKLNYTGANSAYKVIEIASLIAQFGIFILPQQDCGFKYSGVQSFTKNETPNLELFTKQTGIKILPTNFGCADEYAKSWKTKVPMIELVEADFSGAKVVDFNLHLQAS